MNQAFRVLPNSVQLACRVKPNARAGSRILSVSDDVVELAVSAKPQDGAANKAVMELIADVLDVPKTAVTIIRGMKSKDKVVDVLRTSLMSSKKAADQTDDVICDTVRDKLLASL